MDALELATQAPLVFAPADGIFTGRVAQLAQARGGEGDVQIGVVGVGPSGFAPRWGGLGRRGGWGRVGGRDIIFVVFVGVRVSGGRSVSASRCAVVYEEELCYLSKELR